MNDFNRKMENAGARVNQKVSEAAERLEKESADLINYLNKEVVPAVREQSSKALRVAAPVLAVTLAGLGVVLIAAAVLLVRYRKKQQDAVHHILQWGKLRTAK